MSNQGIIERTGAARSRRYTSICEDTPPQMIIAWALERFAGQSLILTTSFGMEGCALIDMCAALGKPLTVVYLDTMFLFSETYALRDRMAERYPHIRFVNGGTTLTPEDQAVQYGDELWKHNPDLCCFLRKVEPMFDVMADVDVWVTGLMRAQSKSRSNIQIVEWDWKYHVLKVNPLCMWDRAKVWDYVKANGVPYNPLHEQGFPTLGCTHCTKHVPGAGPADYSREGRWSGTGKTECGLHGGAGI